MLVRPMAVTAPIDPFKRQVREPTVSRLWLIVPDDLGVGRCCVFGVVVEREFLLLFHRLSVARTPR